MIPKGKKTCRGDEANDGENVLVFNMILPADDTGQLRARYHQLLVYSFAMYHFF